MAIDVDHGEVKREERRREKAAREKFRKAVQAVAGTVEGRHLVHEFLQVSGLDRSAFSTDPGVMQFSCGWQDGGRWWLDAIRQHCPEREAQMRNEAKQEARIAGATDENEE